MRSLAPPPPRRPTLPPPPPESPFDDFPPTPAPLPTAASVFASPSAAPFGNGSFEESEPEFSETPAPPLHQPAPFGAPAFGAAPPLGGGPPPGRRGLPRPGGYLDPAYGANLHMPPAPPQPAVFDPAAGGFGFPETVDFRSGSQPMVVRRRSGPPGLFVLIVLLAAAAGGAKLGHVVTRGAVEALDAATAAGSASQSKK